MPSPIIYALLLISISGKVASRDVSSSYLPTTVRAAQTFAACTQASDCREGLQCFTLHDSGECNRFDLDCICVPDPLQPCLTTSGCQDGEICANTAFFFLNICISKDNDVPPGQIAEATPLPVRTGTLYMDVCTTESRCAGFASCRSVTIVDSTSCFIGGRPCYCYMDRRQPCLKDSNCIEGEVCAEMPRDQYPFCVSRVVEQGRLSISAASMPDNTMGLSLDPCETDEDCKGIRECIEFAAAGSDLSFGACTGRFSCACLLRDNNTIALGDVDGVQLCASSSECEKGEVCARGTAYGNSTACISKDFADTFRMAVQVDAEEEEVVAEEEEVVAEEEDNETEGQVCIDAEALEDMTSAELVYSSHVTAMVLCDEYGSCATRGHVVVWKGQAMMMGSYCRKVGCLQKVIQVNSPRYAMGKKVASKTDGLQYTTFAARYESRIEEAVMATAVRLGL